MVKQNQFVGGIEFYPVRRDANGTRDTLSITWLLAAITILQK